VWHEIESFVGRGRRSCSRGKLSLVRTTRPASLWWPSQRWPQWQGLDLVSVKPDPGVGPSSQL